MEISARQILWYYFQEICQQTRRNLKMWWTNERTDNNTHKPQWQPYFLIWSQYPNPSPCTVGRTGEHMKWQQYHQHQCRLMIRHLDTSTCQILCHFSKWFVSETARLNRCYKTVEIKWSMSYPCLMIPIMSSSIRFELKMISALQWRHNGRDCVSNHLPIVYSTVYSGTDQRKHQSSASLAFVQGIHQWIPRTNGQ